MIDQMCANLTTKICKENPDIDNERAEIIDYGLHLLLGEIPKTFAIIGISYALGVLDLTILTYILMMPYRGVSGGFHLKSHLGCIIGTTLFFSGIGLLAKYLILTEVIKYIVTALIWIFGMLMVRLYAPADTENEPIISKKLRKKKKILSYLALTGTIIASIFVKDVILSNILLYGALFQSAAITRIVYKLTKNKYGHEVYQASQESV